MGAGSRGYAVSYPVTRRPGDPVTRDPGSDLVTPERPPEKKPLRIADAEREEGVQLGLRLDTFRDQRRADILRESDDRLDDFLFVPIGVDTTRDGHVELQELRLAPDQRDETAVPGSEIVECDAEALARVVADRLLETHNQPSSMRSRLVVGFTAVAMFAAGIT